MKEIATQAPLPSFLDNQKIEPQKPKNVMGKDDFMKLLLTQLQNQDPLKPMDAQEFASQLAQFTQMEQLTNIGKGIESLRSGQGDDSKLQALQLIGRNILATGRDFELKEGQSVTLAHNLKPEVHPTKAMIMDASGRVVREIDLSKKETSSEIVWDGKDKDGLQSPPGRYTFRVQGEDQSGQIQESGNEISGRVLGLEMTTKGPMLVVENTGGKIRVELSKVKEVAVDEKPTSPTPQGKIFKVSPDLLSAKESPGGTEALKNNNGANVRQEAGETEPSDTSDDLERFRLPLASSGYLRP